MAIQKGIVHYETKGQKMKTFRHKTVPHLIYSTPAKSVFNKGSEILFENVFFFSEFVVELNRVAGWMARKLKPLKIDDYTLMKVIVP